MTQSDYENITLAAITAIHSEPSEDMKIRVRFLGRDISDHYAIIEDWSNDAQDYADHYFIMFTMSDSEKPFCADHSSTMAQAMMRLAMRFVYDNCDGADTQNKIVASRSGILQNSMFALAEMPG